MALIISDGIAKKLTEKHGVNRDEIIQCFANREGGMLLDRREEHATDPPTQWFVAETNYGRRLKIVFVQSGRDVHIKTAYDPNGDEVRIYNKFAKGPQQ